jgi:hypothetical protein
MNTPQELEHFGVKGMRWGVKKGPQAVSVTANAGKKVKAKGGARQVASEDAIRAAVGKQVARKSTTDALSNAQLREVVTRMQLEQQFSQLGGRTSRLESGKKFLKALVGIGQTVDQAYGMANTGNIGKAFKGGGGGSGGFSGKVFDGKVVSG